MTTQLDLFASQRWRDGRHSWRRRDCIVPGRYDAVEIAENAAKTYVVRHHYSGTYPAACHRFGLIDRETDQLAGVAVLSVPTSLPVLTNVFPSLEPFAQSLELGRFVLDDEVAANGESWFLARCWEMAADHGIRGVVAFSDPVPRHRTDGSMVMPGHVGIIYQASNALYLGRATARTLTMLPDGRTSYPKCKDAAA